MFSIFSVIFVVLMQLVSARNDSLSKQFQFSNQNLTVSDMSFDNRTLFYALYAQSSKQCSIIQEVNPFTNYSVTKKCNFVLKVDRIQLIVGLGTGKAMLIAQEATAKSLKLKTITVHIADCKIKEVDLVEVPLDWSNRQLHRDYIDVVVSEHGFEVIIKGLSHLCTKPNRKVYCGLSFDNDGNKMEGPLIWPKMAYEKIDLVSPVMADATGQGYFFVNRDTSLLAFQLNRKGGPKYVKLWYTPIPHSDVWREGYSIANHVDGMCYSINSTIGCWQTDQEGEVKIQLEFEFDHQFKANIKQCNITQPRKTEDSATQETTTQATTTQAVTMQATTIQLTTAQEATVKETTSQEAIVSDSATEETRMKETVTEITTEEAVIEPNTVIGITVEDITIQDAVTLNNTIDNDVTNDYKIANDVTQSNITLQDNTTESNVVQDTATVQNNVTQENVTVTDLSRNTVSDDNVTLAQVAIDNVTLENTMEDNTVLENTTEHNTVDVITVQGLTTQALTTQMIEIQENTAQDETIRNITVQGITTVQDNTTQKSIARRSLSQIKSTDEQKVWNLFIHNLRNGGFIVLIVTCPNRICDGNEDHYYLMKINAQGKLIGQLEINIKSKCNAESDEVLAKVFENDQGQYCSVRLCKSKTSKDEQLEILVNCYCNSDFK